MILVLLYMTLSHEKNNYEREVNLMIAAETGITLYNVNYVKKMARYYHFSSSGNVPKKPVDGTEIGNDWSLLEPSYSPSEASHD